MAVVYLPPRNRSLPERIAYGVMAFGILILGFFFLAAAVAAGAILAGVVLVRYWWLQRRVRKAAEQEFITTEYSVVERGKDGGPPAPPGDR